MNIKEFIPKKRAFPYVLNDKPSAWGDIPTILDDLIKTFGITQRLALEFGVEYGYSTTALANYFKVIGVDTFEGDMHAGKVKNHFVETDQRIQSHVYENNLNLVTLVKSTYQDFIEKRGKHFEPFSVDLIHVDIVHTYEDTFACGDWSLTKSKAVIFHDTESFPDVKRACIDLAKKHYMQFYNYKASNGLGIITSHIPII